MHPTTIEKCAHTREEHISRKYIILGGMFNLKISTMETDIIALPEIILQAFQAP